MDRELVYSIEEIKNKLEPIFKKYGLKKAAVFGSYARKEAHNNSDVDLLVLLDDTFELENI